MNWWRQFRHKFHHWHEGHTALWDETSEALGCGGGGVVLKVEETCCVCGKWRTVFFRRTIR
jgi:hypothetical protein